VDIPASPPLINRRSLWGLGAVLAIGWSLWQAGIGDPEITLMNRGGWGQWWQFWGAAFHPDLTPAFLQVIGRATWITLAYAICGTTLSLVLGLVGGIGSSQRWWQTLFPHSTVGKPLWILIRGLLAVPRSIHELIWGLLLLNILGLDPLVAVLAITLPFAAIVAKVFSEILDETPAAALQTLLHSGVPPLTAWIYGLFPQALPNLLSYSFYRFECSLRSAAVLGVIGAGGLGYEILLSLQSLRYSQLWTGFYALMLLNGLVDLGSAWIREEMGWLKRLDLQARKSPPPHPRPQIRRTHLWKVRAVGALILISIPLSFWGLQIEWQRLWAPRTWQLLTDLLAQMLPSWPELGTLSPLLSLSQLTLAMSILAITLAGLGGILTSFLAARTFLLPGGWVDLASSSGGTRLIWRWCLWGLIRFLLLLGRAIPPPIWALVFLFILFPGILPGALALAIHNGGILGRLMAEVNENLQPYASRALYTSGATGPQIMLYAVLPQNLGRFLAYILYRWEVCMRETVIVGLVGAGGLGRLMTEQISSFDYGGVTLTLGCFLVLTLGVDLISQQMRSTLH
jgi:phosphonate transport system permease protein